MLHLFQQIREAAAHVRNLWSNTPRVGIVLGSGLGNLANEIRDPVSIPFADIPFFCKTTAIGHAGKLIVGYLSDAPVVAMQGRYHLYEGHTASQASFPIRVLRELGIQHLFLSNASGGLNPAFSTGDIVILLDQINLMFRNPLIGFNDDRLGPRFPDMCCPYDRELGRIALQLGRHHGVHVHQGVYAGVLGPNYETRAEIRMLRKLGADVVGMSTIPEVLVAVHSGLPVLGLSVVTNVCSPDVPRSASGDDVVAIANESESNLSKIVIGVLASQADTKRIN